MTEPGQRAPSPAPDGVRASLEAELDLAERLAEVSTVLLAQRSREDIRKAAVLAFQKARLWAGFYQPDGSTLSPLQSSTTGNPPAVDPICAFEALHELRPVFSAPAGARSARIVTTPLPVPDTAQVVYLPLRYPGGEEVLVLAGAVNPGSSGALRRFSEQLSQAYSNAQLISDLETGHREMRLLLELARTTAQSLEAASIMDAAADFTVRLLDATFAFVFLLDASDGALRARGASASVRGDVPGAIRFRAGDGSVVGRVARDRAPVMMAGLEDVPQGGEARAVAERTESRSVLGVPITSREELIGVLVVVDARPRHFTPQQVELAQATAGQLALSIINARLYESLMESYTMLQQTRAEMVKRERLAALGELSAVLAHEVRNPLGVIFNAISSLRKVVPGPDPEVLLDILSEESDRLNRLVEELLDFARPRALSREAEDVGQVIQDALEAASLDPSTANSHVRVTAEVEPGLPHVPMDRRQIRQALVNVAVNAFQAMPKGGSFRVSARRDGQGPGKPLALRIDLEDEGPGIAQDVLPRIFEPFFTTKAKGTGLGLAVVKRIIEDHDGTVEVRSQGGRGTTFTFRLPLQG